MDPTPMTITACTKRVEALFQGHIIADSGQAKLVREDGREDVHYFPKADVEMEKLVATDHATRDALKGVARYWTVARDGQMIENGAWSYDEPPAGAEALRGLIAFRPDIVEIHVLDRDPDRMWRQEDKIGEYIRHTDSGSGRSQEERWPANVSQPDGETGEFDEDDPRAL